MWSSYFSHLPSNGYFFGTAFGTTQTLPLTSTFFLFVLFLIRVRKRTKKNRAARRGAGFSVNHLRGTNGDWVAYGLLNCTNTTVLIG